jgi:endonuclease YncB( thermonuclease family)
LKFVFVFLFRALRIARLNKKVIRRPKWRRFLRKRRKSGQDEGLRRFDANHAEQVDELKVVSGGAHVIDGDTIVIKGTQIRLFGIDAPELDHPFGRKAKWTLVSICKGQHVRAEITHHDRYGRTVARC